MAAEEKEVIKSSIKYKDVFNFDELYKLIYYWLRDHSWVDPLYKDHDDLVFEYYYSQKDAASGTKEHIIKWQAEKVPNESSYFKFKLNINFMTIALKELEVMHEGKKLEGHKGEIVVEITATIILDYKSEWDKSAVLKNFHNLWKKRIYKSTISMQKDVLQKEAEDLHGAIKKYLNLKGFLMEFQQEPFYISKSYPE